MFGIYLAFVDLSALMWKLLLVCMIIFMYTMYALDFVAYVWVS